MNALLLLAALTAQAAQALPTPGNSGDLEVIWTDEAGVLRIDPASISREGDLVRVDTITVLDSPRPDGTISAASRIAIDCGRQTFFYERIAIYNSAGLDSERSFTLDRSQFEPIGQLRGVQFVAARVCPPAPTAALSTE